MRSHQYRVEGQEYLPPPADHSSFDVVQDAIGFLVCVGTWLAHVQLTTHSPVPSSPFQQGYAQSFHPSAHTDSSGCQLQNLSLGFVEPNEVLWDLLCKPV